MRIARTLATIFSAFTSVAVLCCAGDAAPARFVPFGTPTVSEHVYVLDKAGALFRFPIVNGVIAAQPDAMLATAPGASGLAIANDGRIYISDSNNRQILIYRAGAQGHERPRVRIPVKTAPFDLVVADTGFVFARLEFRSNGSQEVDVISPRHKVINVIDESDANSLALDPEGNLYVGSHNRINVYATPGRNLTWIRRVCTPTFAIAVGPNEHLYVARSKTIIRVRDTFNACQVPKGRFEIRAAVSPGLLLPYIATDGARLFTVEYANDRLLQLDPNNGSPQVPIANIQMPAFAGATAIAIGL